MSARKLKPLDPPDRKRCQAEKPNGNTPFTLGGVPGMVRCKSRPVVTIHETRPGRDGRKGSMSLCASCLSVFKKQHPGKARHVKLKEIK